MANEVIRCTEALINAMMSSDEYQTYLKYEEELKQKPELRQRIDEFRSRNYRLQKQEGVDLYDAVDNLEREYEHLRRDTFANGYLEAELAVCRMMQNVQIAMVKSLNISIPDEV
ncbi:MAG TPA: YlbF family regulator [Candidatus Pelethocola excrementipullorum]|nr:YlbF family regulator [Candidatus Pelethocola excrementipullorum]